MDDSREKVTISIQVFIVKACKMFRFEQNGRYVLTRAKYISKNRYNMFALHKEKYAVCIPYWQE